MRTLHLCRLDAGCVGGTLTHAILMTERLFSNRLVEALEMYDNPHMDSYLSDEQDRVDLGGGHLGSIHAFGGHMGLGDDLDSDEKALLGNGKRKVCMPILHLVFFLVWRAAHAPCAAQCMVHSSQHCMTADCSRQGGYAKSVDSYGGYASEMNPKLKGKKVPQLPKEPVEEYIPPPFNANAPQVR